MKAMDVRTPGAKAVSSLQSSTVFETPFTKSSMTFFFESRGMLEMATHGPLEDNRPLSRPGGALEEPKHGLLALGRPDGEASRAFSASDILVASRRAVRALTYSNKWRDAFSHSAIERREELWLPIQPH